MYARFASTALAAFLLVHAFAVDSATRKSERVKLIERSFESDTFISLPGLNLASSYPDAIEVHGPRDSRITDVDIHLFGLSHGMPANLDILVVAPNGRAALVMSDAGSQPIAPGIDLTLDDGAKRRLPRIGEISSGRYRPANYGEDDPSIQRNIGSEAESDPGDGGEPGEDGPPGEPGDPGKPGEPGSTPGFENDDFPDPAPQNGAGVRLATFNGMDPTGTWQIFIRPDGPAAGQLSGGWGMTIKVKKRR